MLSNNSNSFGMFSTGNNGLPYSAESITGSMININVNHPPYVPNNVPASEEVRPYIPVIAGCIIEHIQQTAQQNNLRAFMFNQLSRNNYCNEDFNDIVTFTTCLLMYALYAEKLQGNAEQLIQQAVRKGAELFAANNVAKFQQLADYLSQEGINEVKNLVNQVQQLSGKIQMMLNQINNANMQQNRASFSNTAFGNSNVQVSNTGSSVFKTGVSSMNNGNVGTGQSDARFSGRYSMPGIKRESPEPVETVQMTKEIVIETAPTEPVVIDQSDIKWNRSDQQPYPPIYNIREYELRIARSQSGLPDLSIGEKSQKAMFDYETHTVYTNIALHPATRPRLDKNKITQANKQVEDAAEGGFEVISQETDALPDYKIIVRPDHSVEYSLESCALDHEVYQKLNQIAFNKEQFNIFQSNFVLAQSLGSLSEDDRNEVKRISDSRTFEEILAKLKGSAPILSRRAWNTIEKNLTKTINTVLRLQLSMDLKIDSFFMDIESLIPHLKELSTIAHDRFMDNQVSMIHQACALLPGDIKKSIDEAILTDKVGEKEYVADIDFLYTKISITSLALSSEELGIEVFKDLGSIILPPQSNSLYAVAVALMKNKAVNDHMTGTYVMLTDGVILRLAKGLIGMDCYTCSTL